MATGRLQRPPLAAPVVERQPEEEDQAMVGIPTVAMKTVSGHLKIRRR